MGKNSKDSLEPLICSKIEGMRGKLLDLTKRNPLISAKLSDRSNSILRVVDELPDVLFEKISEGSMKIIPLPAVEIDPQDEKTPKFKRKLSNARLTDEVYQTEVDAIDSDSPEAPEELARAERRLKDRIREVLGLKKRQTKEEFSLREHARNHGISPLYDLPNESEGKRHDDNDIQTLLLPDVLERRLSLLLQKHRSWEQETGTHVLQAAFGLIEWKPKGDSKSYLAPIILLPIEIERKQSRGGFEFHIQSRGENPEVNIAFQELLKNEFGITLPEFKNEDKIEDYFRKAQKVIPKKLEFKVRRQIVFGVFPSAKLAMYKDLDTSDWNFGENNVLDNLLGGNNSVGVSMPFAEDYEVDDPLVESKVPLLILDADSSQFSVLADVADGKNLAVEGPPGTGKSQTIVNTIAAALAEKKKVLFVAEKTAALEVVKSRLEACKIGEFILPLQATRSSKEEVVQSIRDRDEMSNPRNPSDLDKNINQYRSRRDEMKSYIDIISSQYGKSGLTIHRVLGLAIQTRQFISRIPVKLKNRKYNKPQKLTTSDLSHIEECCALIEASWAEQQNNCSYWHGITSDATAPHLADSILTQAAGIASDHQLATQCRSQLPDIGFSQEIAEDGIKQIISTLDSAFNCTGKYDGQLIVSITENDCLNEFKWFLEEAAQNQSDFTDLELYLKNPLQSDLLSLINAAKKLLRDCQVEYLTMQELEVRLSSVCLEIDKLQKEIGVIDAIESIIPNCGDIPVSLLAECCKVAKQYPREIFEGRSSKWDNRETRQVIRENAIIATELTKRKDDLIQHFDFSRLPYATAIRECADIISNSNIFSFLFSDYRKAKRQYMLISNHEKFNRIDAAKQMLTLQTWLDENNTFESNILLKNPLGSHFKGVQTNFDYYLRLLDFYDAANAFIGRNGGGTIIRDFLKSSPTDSIDSLPSSNLLEASEKSPNQIRLELKGLLEAREILTIAAEQIADLRGLFVKPDAISLIQIKNLEDKLTKSTSKYINLEQNKKIKDLLGAGFQGANTVSSQYSESIQVAGEILQLNKRMRIPLANVLSLYSRDQLPEFACFFKKILEYEKGTSEGLMELSKLSGIESSVIIQRSESLGIGAFLKSASEDKDGLRANAVHNSNVESLKKFGLDHIPAILREDSIPLSQITQLTMAWIYQKMAADVYQAHPDLDRFHGQKLGNLRNQIAKLDKEIIQLSGKRLRSELHSFSLPPDGVGRGPRKEWTEMALIRNELSKKKRIIPARDLVRRAGKALLELKPCWMMSPLAVAQYIPKGTLKFDLVIIDEASQMPPANAIGSLARAAQTMVVGDTNQLPPSNFFSRTFEEEESQELEPTLEESILELANGVFHPKRRLRWHYRSRDSSLISFSNRYVYEDKLVIFPSASQGNPNSGVSFKKVNGLYSKGTNPLEAQEIVNAIISFMTGDLEEPNSKRRSLGVVLMNQKQRDLVEELFDQERATNKKTNKKVAKYLDYWKKNNEGLETFFIKNLENVQGDERDTIFIGTVYGPERESAPVMQRFGPINGLSGKRRLNVLFTRAKHQIITFSSMDSTDVRADRSSNPGAYLLKKWLEYSNTGQLESGTITEKEPDSEFEEFVIEQIQSMGCEPIPQVGVSGFSIDIGVKHPSWPHGFLLGVECDGATYHSSKSARDRDRLRQDVLEGLGWDLHRIWSTDWFQDPGSEAEKLRLAIEKLLQKKIKSLEK